MPYVILKSKKIDATETHVTTNDQSVLDYLEIKVSGAVKLTPIQVLDKLEKISYKVVAMSTLRDERHFNMYCWTLNKNN